MPNIFRIKDCPVFLTGKTDSVTDSAYFPAGVGMMKFFQCPGRNEEIIPKNSIVQVKKDILEPGHSFRPSTAAFCAGIQRIKRSI